MVPAFQLMQDRIDQINRVLREQITGIRVVRAFVREPEETRAVRGHQRGADRDVAHGRPADVVDVPARQLPHQHLERRRALDRRRPHRRRRHQRRVAGRLPHVPRADPVVGRDGDVHGLDDPEGVGVRRPHPGGPRHRAVGAAAGRSPSPTPRSTASSSCATSASTTPARSTPCSRASRSRPGPGRRPPSSAAPAPARRRW